MLLYPSRARYNIVNRVCAPTTFIVEFGRLPIGRRFCSRASCRRQWARVCLRALDRFSRLENGVGGGEFAFRIRTQGLARRSRAQRARSVI